MRHDNYTAKAEIALAIKKIQVLGLITFRGCSTPHELPKSIDVLGPKTYTWGGYERSHKCRDCRRGEHRAESCTKKNDGLVQETWAAFC